MKDTIRFLMVIVFGAIVLSLLANKSRGAELGIENYEKNYVIYGVERDEEGNEEENIKYQISIQKAFFDNLLHVGYSQTNIWAIRRDSSPFLDTSHRPSVWIEDNTGIITVKAGWKHESNGRAGGESRSWERVFGSIEGKTGVVYAKATIYEGFWEEQDDIESYSGLIELHTAINYKGVRASATIRRWNNVLGLQKSFGDFAIYAQYHDGYGETLLNYNKRTKALRVGISLN